MLCPKCKKEIDNNTLICTHCSAKVASACKKCGTYNLITSTECSCCGEVLIQICPNCGAANLPKTISCRKCGKTFFKENTLNQANIPVYQANSNSQQKIKAKIVEAIKNADTKVITISGERARETVLMCLPGRVLSRSILGITDLTELRAIALLDL